MLLTGTFNRAVDDKLRVAIPKPLRLALGSPEGEGLYIAPGTDGSLVLYSEKEFERLARRLDDVSPTQKDVRAFTRLFYARAQRVDVDPQGRIRVPQDLAELVGLEKEAVLLGVQDHLELWTLASWQAYLAEQQARFDEIAESAFGKNE